MQNISELSTKTIKAMPPKPGLVRRPEAHGLSREELQKIVADLIG